MKPAPTLTRLAIAGALAGAAIAASPALASAASTCTFEPDALPARVNIIDQSGGSAMRVVRSGQFIGVADGSGAPTLCASPSGTLATVNNTDLIRVFGAGTSFTDEYVVGACWRQARRPSPTASRRSRPPSTPASRRAISAWWARRSGRTRCASPRAAA